MPEVTAAYSPDDFIPLSVWGKDHHSTLAYVASVMTDCGGFQVGTDARMRSNRRNFRVMAEECPRPKRASGPSQGLAMAMRPEHGTRLNNGQTLTGHDDWACLQDAAQEGLFTVTPDNVQPGVTLQFSEKGLDFCRALLAHKMNGGSYANFTFQAVVPG